MKYFCHPTAIIDDGASIGEDSRIWHFSHVCSGAKIGVATSLGQNVFVGNNVSIGSHCKIQNNVSVYDNVVIEDYVFCGPSVVFTNVINPRAFIERKNEYKSTVIREGVTLGANSTIVCGNEIGRYAFVGAGCLVTRSVPDFALVLGVPGRQVGWMSKYGERLDLPLLGSGSATCAHTGTEYVLEDSVLTIKGELN